MPLFSTDRARAPRSPRAAAIAFVAAAAVVIATPAAPAEPAAPPVAAEPRPEPPRTSAATPAAKAPAAGAPSNDTEELISLGVALRKHGDDEAALPFFRRAYERSQTPRAAAQLGFDEQALGLWVAAERHLGEAASAATDPWISKNADLLSESLRFVQKHVGSIELVASVSGADIVIDGLPAGRTPLPAAIRVATGERRIEARARGYAPFVATVTVHPGTKAATIVAHLDPAPIPSPSIGPPPPPGAPFAVNAATPLAPNAAAAPNAATSLALPSVVAPSSAGVGAVPAATAPPGPERRPVYKTWWFWTGVAVLVAGAAIGVAASRGSDAYACGGSGRVCATGP